MRPIVPYLLLPALLWACSATERDALAEGEPPPGLPQFVQWSPRLAQGGQPDPERMHYEFSRQILCISPLCFSVFQKGSKT